MNTIQRQLLKLKIYSIVGLSNSHRSYYTANRPDIVIKDKTNNTCMIIDMSILSDRNISAKVFEKLSKYKHLEIEVKKMWQYICLALTNSQGCHIGGPQMQTNFGQAQKSMLAVAPLARR